MPTDPYEAYQMNGGTGGNAGGLGAAYAAYSAAAAPQQQAYTNINANLGDQGVLQQLLAGNAVGGLTDQYNAQMNELGTRRNNNAIDMNNIAGQIGTTMRLGDLAQNDVASRLAELYRNRDLAWNTFYAADDFRKKQMGLANTGLGNALGFLNGQRGFANQDFDRTNRANAVQFDAQRRGQLADYAARGGSASMNSVLGAQDIQTNRGLAGEQAQTTLGRAMADIKKGEQDAYLARDTTEVETGYRTKQAELARDSTLSGITAGVEGQNTQRERNTLEYGQKAADLKASWDKMKNIGDSYGVSAEQMKSALDRGIEKIGLQGKIDALQIANAINSNDAAAAASALQVLQMALGNAGYAPPQNTAPTTVVGYTPTYSAGGGVRVS